MANENKSEDSQDFFPGIKHVKLTKEELDAAVKKAKSGDQKAFEDILCHYSTFISYLTKEFFVQGGQRQDLIQECGIKLINIIRTYNEKKGGFNSFAQGGFRKHVMTIISREQAQKRKVLNTSYSLDEFLYDNKEDSRIYMDTLSSENSETTAKLVSQSDIVKKDYEQYLIEEICKVLSEMEGRVFILRFINGLSYKEIAKQLHLYKLTKTGKRRLDCKSVDNCVWRAKPKIKKAMEKLGIKPTDLDKTEEKLLEIESVKRKPGRPKKVVEKTEEIKHKNVSKKDVEKTKKILKELNINLVEKKKRGRPPKEKVVLKQRVLTTAKRKNKNAKNEKNPVLRNSSNKRHVRRISGYKKTGNGHLDDHSRNRG